MPMRPKINTKNALTMPPREEINRQRNPAISTSSQSSINQASKQAIKQSKQLYNTSLYLYRYLSIYSTLFYTMQYRLLLVSAITLSTASAVAIPQREVIAPNGERQIQATASVSNEHVQAQYTSIPITIPNGPGKLHNSQYPWMSTTKLTINCYSHLQLPKPERA